MDTKIARESYNISVNVFGIDPTNDCVVYFQVTRFHLVDSSLDGFNQPAHPALPESKIKRNVTGYAPVLRDSAEYPNVPKSLPTCSAQPIGFSRIIVPVNRSRR